MTAQISKFVSLFADLPNQRQEWKIRDNLVDIIFIVVVAAIADWEDIEWFAKEKEAWFCIYPELPGGIPSYDTMHPPSFLFFCLLLACSLIMVNQSAFIFVFWHSACAWAEDLSEFEVPYPSVEGVMVRLGPYSYHLFP